MYSVLYTCIGKYLVPSKSFSHGFHPCLTRGEMETRRCAPPSHSSAPLGPTLAPPPQQGSGYNLHLRKREQEKEISYSHERKISMDYSMILKTSRFWPRVRARALRAPFFFGSLTCKTGALRAPRPSQLRCFLFTPQNFPSGPNSGRQGCVYLSFGLSCSLLSYIASD